MELNIECELLETDISSGSYNYASKRGDYDARKLVYKPLEEMKLKFSKPLSALDNCQDRCECRDCHKKSMYYCSRCMIALPCTANLMPMVSLPFNVHIIKDKREHNTKSTAIHAKVIAKDHVQIYDALEIPNYQGRDDVFLVFPDEKAVTIGDTFGLDTLIKDPERLKQMTIVFIDGTWKQAKSLVQNSQLRALPKIRVDGKQTLYWRHQTGKSDANLATIEVRHKGSSYLFAFELIIFVRPPLSILLRLY